MEEYLIHDNGGRPFKVVIDGNDVKVYKKSGDYVKTPKYFFSEWLLPLYRHNCQWNRLLFEFKWIGEDEPIAVFENVRKVFIGDDTCNEMFKGNSILLQLDDTTYVFIGWKIYSFIWNTQIIQYKSPVGNSDVPYPYAIDEHSNYLLMLNFVALSNIPIDKGVNPYFDYYYRINLFYERGVFKLFHFTEEEREEIRNILRTKLNCRYITKELIHDRV